MDSTGDDSYSSASSDHAKDDAQRKSKNKETKKRDEEAIGQSETNVVMCMRLAVLAVLIASTVAVAVGVNSYTKGKEQSSFESDFNADANKVLAGISASIDLTMGAVDSFAVSMVSFTRFTNMSWPYVTIPDFAVRATKVHVLAHAAYVAFHPYVRHDQRKMWENYTAHHNAWVNESIDIQAHDPDYHGPNLYDFYVLDFIYDYNQDPYNESAFYLPEWQSSPCIPRLAPYNWNLLSVYNTTSVLTMLRTKNAVMTEAYHLPDPNNAAQVSDTQLDVEFFADYVNPGEDPSEPISDIYYPIVNSLDAVRVRDPGNQTLLGVFTLSIYWRKFIENILPIGANGIVIVFESACNPAFTFQINGPDAVYLGRGDRHQSQYDHLEMSAWLLKLNAYLTTNSSYSGIPLDKNFCPAHMRLYPSQTMESNYVTRQPMILTIVAVCIFVFTSLLFVCYDRMVEYRQKLVMKKAVQSSAIVSSLFPSTVRDRLFQSTETPAAPLGTFKRSGAQEDRTEFLPEASSSYSVGAEGTSERKSPPIADLFHNTTIFFADLVGFTKWSADRKPCEVFELLETLYGAFDACAERRDVFKVETVGDCYVAVTGIPSPQEDHAVIMVKFARDCFTQLSLKMNDLTSKFGKGTRDLSIRIGLHSGSTTAGVLRGLKGRFQLFGDTVNTAARMESNGVPGRVHMSQTTADALHAKGKGHWVIAREDKIVAKGKGEMQTYFATVRTEKSVCTTKSGGLSSSDENESNHRHPALAASSRGTSEHSMDKLDEDSLENEESFAMDQLEDYLDNEELSSPDNVKENLISRMLSDRE